MTHDCEIAEIEAQFVYNKKRKAVWSGFLEYLAQITVIPAVNVIYVDGSFITDKESFDDTNEPPKDIDIVLEFANFKALSFAAAQHPQLFDPDLVKQDYNVDLWFWTEGFPNDLRKFFQYLRVDETLNRNVPAGTLKGILKVSLQNERQRQPIE